MRLKKTSSIDYVHHFSDLTFMKFKPKTIINPNTDYNINKKHNNNNTGLIAKFKSLLWPQPV